MGSSDDTQVLRFEFDSDLLNQLDDSIEFMFNDIREAASEELRVLAASGRKVVITITTE